MLERFDDAFRGRPVVENDKPLKIYVASSWRNVHQQQVVKLLRDDGNAVYDFREPRVGEVGFSWSSIDQNWQSWTPAEYAKALNHPVAVHGFSLDMEGLLGADLCVLVLPSGRSASFEYGYHSGMVGRQGVVYMPEPCEPELMYAGSDIVSKPEALTDVVRARSSLIYAGATTADPFIEAVSHLRRLAASSSKIEGMSAKTHLMLEVLDKHVGGR